MSKRILLVIIGSVVVLSLLGCPQGKRISDIQRDPAYYQTHEVAIRGTVVNSFGLLGTGAYELDDGTGRMWVFAEATGVPSKGSQVVAIGRVQPTLSLGGRSFTTVLRERQRKH